MEKHFQEEHDPSHRPVDALVTKGASVLQRDFIVVGRKHIRTWRAFLILGLFVGLASGVILVANRSGEFEKGKAATATLGPITATLTISPKEYELDQALKGIGNITVTQAVNVVILTELFQNGNSAPAFSKSVQTDLPVGSHDFSPQDLLGVAAFPSNPAIIGTWVMKMTVTITTNKSFPLSIQDTFTIVMPRPVTIMIDGASNQGTIGLQGMTLVPRVFTIFAQPYVSQTTRDLIVRLKPQLWRIFLAGDITDALFYNPKKLTYDTEAGYYYQVQKPGAQCGTDGNPVNCLPGLLPWEDNYAKYRQYITNVAQGITQNNLQIEYMEWWNESDANERFGTDQQMFETFKVFHDTVRSLRPGQKIIAPTAQSFNQPYLRGFLDFVANKNLKIDALSWHEWDPRNITKNVQIVRSWFAQNPRYCPNGKCPEIHINEFNPPPHYFIPGWQAAYLASFENSNVDWGGSPSCFNIDLPGGRKMNTCYSAYNGFFMENNETTQPLYWVRRVYAKMQNMTKLQVQSSSEQTVAIGSKSDSEKTVRILMGRIGCGQSGKWCASGTNFFDSNEQKGPSIPVTVNIPYYPYAIDRDIVYVEMYRIPNENVPGPFTETDLLKQKSVQTITVSRGSTVTFTIPSYQDGDAYFIVVKSTAPSSALSALLFPPW